MLSTYILITDLVFVVPVLSVSWLSVLESEYQCKNQASLVIFSPLSICVPDVLGPPILVVSAVSAVVVVFAVRPPVSLPVSASCVSLPRTGTVIGQLSK